MELKNKTISQIAAIIRKDWKKVNLTAAPYLRAMAAVNSVDDRYYADSARTIVLYFLNNAWTWHGEVAKAVKAELKSRLA